MGEEIYGEFIHSSSSKQVFSEIGDESISNDAQNEVDIFLAARGRTATAEAAAPAANEAGYDGYGGYEDDFADASPVRTVKKPSPQEADKEHYDDNNYNEHENNDNDTEFIKIGNMVLSKHQAKLYGIKKASTTNMVARNTNSSKKSNKNVKKSAKTLSNNMESIAKPARKYEEPESKNKPFGKESERANCTFKPSRSKAAQSAMKNPDCGYDFIQDKEEEVGGQYKLNAFLKNQEIKEKHRRGKKDKDYKEACYNDKLDKLRCPNCGNPQSYDEFMEKRMRCPGDICNNMIYENNNSFFMQSFERRMEKSNKNRLKIIEHLKEESAKSREDNKLKRTAKQRELMDKIGKGGNFLLRMIKDTEDKGKKMKELEDNTNKACLRDCTFEPKLNIDKRLLKNRTKGVMESVGVKVKEVDENLMPKKIVKAAKVKVKAKAKKIEAVNKVEKAPTPEESDSLMRKKFESLLD